MRVVLVAPTWLGDAAMSLPLVGFLSASPDVRLTVLARWPVGRLYCGLDGVCDLLCSAERRRIGRIQEWSAAVRAVRADGAIVLPPSFSSGLSCFLGGPKARVGFRSDARRFLLTASVDPRPLRDEHLSQSYLRLGRLLLEALGLAGGERFVVPRPRVFANEVGRVRERLESEGCDPAAYAVVVPGATYGPAKRWPAEKFRTLVRALSKDVFVVLAGTQEERALCDWVGAAAPGTTNLAGRTTLGELMALLGGARLVVTNDSGAPHVAASLGAPVVVIFGSTSPRWTSPLGESVRVVYEPVPCSPCFRRRCPTRLECYEGVSVERVLDEAKVLLRSEKGVEKERSDW